MINKVIELNTTKIVYVYTNLDVFEPNINHKLLFRIFGNLTILKQRHYYRRFYH